MKKTIAAWKVVGICIFVFASTVALGQASESSRKPEVVERVTPIYPVTARRQGIEGLVVVRVRIDAQGKIVRISIRRSPHELLSDAVEAALKKWKFRAALKEGQAIGSVLEFEFAFNLRERDEPVGKYEVAAPDPDTVAKYVASMDGSEVFRTEYWRAAGHKAFASADEGSWAWVGSRSSIEQAVDAARENCDRDRNPMTRPCRIVDIDGQWQPSVERTATPLRLLSPFEVTSHSREVVESWGADKKAKALPLLDQCRAEADRFVQVWRTQDIDAIYAAVGQEMRDLYSRARLEQSVTDMRHVAGLMGHATFRQQNLVTRWGDDDLRLDLYSVVVYSAVTSLWKEPGMLLTVTLTREAGMCRVNGFQYLSLGAAMPPWLPRESGMEPERGT